MKSLLDISQSQASGTSSTSKAPNNNNSGARAQAHLVRTSVDSPATRLSLQMLDGDSDVGSPRLRTRRSDAVPSNAPVHPALLQPITSEEAAASGGRQLVRPPDGGSGQVVDTVAGRKPTGERSHLRIASSTMQGSSGNGAGLGQDAASQHQQPGTLQSALGALHAPVPGRAAVPLAEPALGPVGTPQPAPRSLQMPESARGPSHLLDTAPDASDAQVALGEEDVVAAWQLSGQNALALGPAESERLTAPKPQTATDGAEGGQPQEDDAQGLDTCCWHEVHAIRSSDPVDGR